jgi:uncharacterized protein YjbI with pentapeptide repeats
MCQYAYPQGESGQRACPHPDYGNSRFCVFHHPGASLKTLDFEEAFEVYLRTAETHPQVSVFDFEGFVFPALSLSERTFLKPVSFRNARFVGHANFRRTRFARNADFREATFGGMADFQQATFAGHSDFSRASFSGMASFPSAAFSGFTTFHQTRFSGQTTFRKTTFAGIVAFRSADFIGNADFQETAFAGTVYFPDTTFGALALFQGALFQGQVDFQRARFDAAARFQSAQFSGNTRFQAACFADTTQFRRAVFSGNTGFQHTVFAGAADFQQTIFQQRIDFHEARFLGEVDFGQARFAMLRHLPGAAPEQVIRLDGAVLEAASFPTGAMLSGYCFRDAFLIGISLAGRRLEHCDFTGAVLYQVHTDGWQPDAQTLHNTRYIYTDYQPRNPADDSGTPYQPVEASRVPATGTFGDLEHHEFTLASCFQHRYRWHTTLLLPDELRSSVLGALPFFCEYLRKTCPPADLHLQVTPEGPWVRLVFATDQAELRDAIEPRFKAYIRDLFQPLDQGDITLPMPGRSEAEHATFLNDYRVLRQRMQQELRDKRLHALRLGTVRAYEADLVAAFQPFFENGHAQDLQTLLQLLHTPHTPNLLAPTPQGTIT